MRIATAAGPAIPGHSYSGSALRPVFGLERVFGRERARGQAAVRRLGAQPDLADRFARAITLCASAYLFVRIGMGLLG